MGILNLEIYFIFKVQVMNHRYLLQIAERFWQKAFQVTEMGLFQYSFALPEF